MRERRRVKVAELKAASENHKDHHCLAIELATSRPVRVCGTGKYFGDNERKVFASGGIICQFLLVNVLFTEFCLFVM